MTKGEFLEKIKDYPDDIEIKVYDMMNGNCRLSNVKECVDVKVEWGGTLGNPTKKIIKTPYIQVW